jgi:hypothetical protein
MADDPKVGEVLPDGGEAKPGPTPSEGQDASVQDDAALRKLVTEIVRSTVDSLKDKRFDKYDKLAAKLGDFEPVLEKVRALGKVSPEDLASIQRDLEFDEMKRRVLGESKTQTGESAVGGSRDEIAAEATLKIAKKFGFDLSDPDVTRIVRDNDNIEDIAYELASLKEKRANKSIPTEASVASPTGGSGSPETLDALLADFESAKKNPLSPAYATAKKKLEERGWK